jgi:hypothetical protein
MPEIRRRIAALRAQQADVDRAIVALEALQRLRLARVVELVPHDIVIAAQRQRLAWEADPPLAA